MIKTIEDLVSLTEAHAAMRPLNADEILLRKPGCTEEEIAKRATSIGREVSELRENGLAGSPAELVDKIGRYAEAGSQRIYLQTLDLGDLDHLELVASEVVPQLG